MFSITPQALEDDRWWKARQYTSQFKGIPSERLITWAIQSFPGAATRRVPQEILMAGKGFGVDVNKYRMKVNLRMLADLGMTFVDLRLFGPRRWVWGKWEYAQDESFEIYLNQLAQISGVMVGFYGVYNPWLDEESSYTSPLDPNVEYFKLYAKNYLAYMTYPIWDVEVKSCVKGSNQENGITATNLTKGLGRTMAQTAAEFGNVPGTQLPRIPEMYSATWYLNLYGEVMKTWLEQRIPPNSTNPEWLPWMAWYLLQSTKTYAKPDAYFSEVNTPNGLQENSYLHARSERLAAKWQLTSNLIGPWCEDGKGTDASILYSTSLTDYRYLHNWPGTTTPPPPPPDPGDTSWKEALAAHNADRHAHAHTHVTGQPV